MIYYKVHAKGEHGALCVESGYKNLARGVRLVGEEWGDVVDCRRCLKVLEQRRRADKMRVLKARRSRIEEALRKVTAAVKAQQQWICEYGAQGWAHDSKRASELDEATKEALAVADEALKP